MRRSEKLGLLLNASLEGIENRINDYNEKRRVERSRSQVQVHSIKYGYMHVNS